MNPYTLTLFAFLLESYIPGENWDTETLELIAAL